MSRTDSHTCLILCVAMALVTSAGLNSYVESGELTWPAINSMIKADYPQVRHLTTADLVVMLQSDSTPAPILLDVRQPDEFSVSHLQGALLAPELPDAIEALDDVDKSYPIVVYCSVGYRSGALAAELQENGYTNVYNLEGSIFTWANEGRPVFAGGDRVYRVHPYNAKWGVLLDRRFWPESFE
jgi:rhodanese-related sulfurtransferase